MKAISDIVVGKKTEFYFKKSFKQLIKEYLKYIFQDKLKSQWNNALSIKNVNNCSNTNIYSYIEASSGQSYNLYLNNVHFFNTGVN